ncbi:MAG: tetratricopeptide repeat protein [Desulfovibrionaceae bacterium]|nr:tetratricopeptide repeat protein [Desulfovibrionaceae bacterium]
MCAVGLFRLTFWLSALALLALPAPARALDWYWGAHPDHERLVLVLDGPAQGYGVQRTGRQRVDVTLPRADRTTRPSPLNLAGADLLSSVTATPDGVAVGLSTNAFGYVQFALEDANKLVIDFFRDPVGARWQPLEGATARPAPAPQAVRAAQATPPAVPQAPQSPAARPAQSAAARPAPRGSFALSAPGAPAPAGSGGSAAPAGPAAPREAPLADGPENRTAPQAPGTAVADATLPAATTSVTAPGATTGPVSAARRRPFFAVPYAYRSALNPGGPGSWDTFAASQPAPGTAPPAPLAAQAAPTSAPGAQPVPVALAPQSYLNRTDAAPRQTAQSQSAQIQAPQPASVQSSAKPSPAPAPRSTAAPAVPVNADQAAQGTTQALSQYNAPISRPGTDGSLFRGRLSWAPPPELASKGPATPEQAQELAKSLAEVTRQSVEEAQATKKMNEVAATADAQSVAQEAKRAEEALTGDTAGQAAGGDQAVQDQAADQAGQGQEGGSGSLAEGAAKIREAHMTQDGEVVDFNAALMEAKVALNNEQYQDAVDKFYALKTSPNLPADMREEVLYTYAEAVYALHKDKFRDNFQKITEPFIEAMNYNLKSTRVPGTLLQLGLFNLRVDNIAEAEAYFNILKDKFPGDDNIPLVYYYWGDYFFKHKQYQKAADNFQYVVQNYPDTKFVREASVGLAESLIKLGYEKQAFQIVDYIEKRWPRFYIEYLPFMRLLADVNYKLGNYPKARGNYWTYYNLDPEGEFSDIVLARLGDIYVQNNQIDAAREVYQKAAAQFPNKDGGLVAQMRLAESGIYDEPSVKQMFTVFDRPFSLSPSEVYTKIVQEHPDSDLAPLAQLKLAMWRLWNKKYRDAIAEVAAFERRFPNSPLLRRAKEVALQSFEEMVHVFSQEKNYDSIIRIWNEFPVVRASQDMLSPAVRVALAYSFWQKGRPDEAVALADPLLTGSKVKQYSEQALQMVLTIYSQALAWDRIPPLAKRIELWELTDPTQRELNYAMALAYENMGRPDKAEPLWNRLAEDRDLDLGRQAYALYFLAQDARRNRDLPTAYQRAEDSLSAFYETKSTDAQKIKDLLGLLMDVTESSGRVREALKWAGDYAKYVKKGDADWPALQYRLAQLYRKGADTGKWKNLLTALKQDMPQTLYGRMAASELQAYQLEQQAQRYAPTGTP